MKSFITKVAVGRLLVAAAATGAVVTAPGASAAPNFQVPFPCGETWSGQTRSGHSPAMSVDFNHAGGDEGWKVTASASGKVSRVANEGNTSYGRWIEISHGSGYTTRYAHLSSQNVSVGQSVSAGQFIGRVGNTGGSTGSHLHFEQRRYGDDIAAYFDGSRALYWGTKNYTSRNCGGGGTNPSNPNTIGEICGSGYKVIDSKAITGAKVYLTYSSASGKNCVATIKTSSIGKKTKTTAFLQVAGGTRSTDSGYYSYYAGPVKKSAANKCVKWGGSTSAASYTSPFEHCG